MQYALSGRFSSFSIELSISWKLRAIDLDFQGASLIAFLPPGSSQKHHEITDYSPIVNYLHGGVFDCGWRICILITLCRHRVNGRKLQFEYARNI